MRRKQDEGIGTSDESVSQSASGVTIASDNLPVTDKSLIEILLFRGQV